MTDTEKLDLLLLKVTDISTDVGQLKDEMREVKADISELKTDVGQLKDEMREVKADISELKTDVGQLKDEMREVKADISELKTDVAQLQDEMAETKTNVFEIKLYLENEILTNIQRVAEGHLDLSRNLHDAMRPQNEVEFLSVRVSVLESDVREIKRSIS